MVEIVELIRSERNALVELLEGLSLGEWATPSLCHAWSVRDVATHLAWTPTQGPTERIAGLVRGGLRANKLNLDNVTRWSRRETGEIVERLRTGDGTGTTLLGASHAAVLTDAVVHAVDIRRPLERSGRIARDSFVTAAEFLLDLRWPLTGLVGGSPRQRVRGVRLVADDLEWSHGDGPDVRGTAETLLLVLSGRPIGPGELAGAGAVRIYGRL